MNVRERILTIRLMEKLQRYPALKMALGITVCSANAPEDAAKRKEK